MKKYVFTIKERKNNLWKGIIYRISNNNLNYITDFSFSLGCCRGTVSEAFQALMECGEIPRKWENSSLCDWRGRGYFDGEVTKHYSITEI